MATIRCSGASAEPVGRTAPHVVDQEGIPDERRAIHGPELSRPGAAAADTDERRIDRECPLEALPFVLLPIQRLRPLEQQPGRALEHLLVFLAGLLLHLTPEGGERVVQELDSVEVIKDGHGPGQLGAHRERVGGREIDGHRLDSCLRPPQPSPEGAQRIDSFDVTHKDHRPALQIQHYAQIPMRVADRDLVDGPEVQGPKCGD